MNDIKFTPGMVVAYGEMHQGVMHRVICLMVVKTVGKRDVKTQGSSASRFRLDGQEASKTYWDRNIRPLTKALLSQAVADRASCLHLAEGKDLES